MIDPKPMAGDPHYEVAPMLWNRLDEVVARATCATRVRRRFHTLVDTAGLDEDRARDWVVVRELHNALWALEDAARASGARSTPRTGTRSPPRSRSPRRCRTRRPGVSGGVDA